MINLNPDDNKRMVCQRQWFSTFFKLVAHLASKVYLIVVKLRIDQNYENYTVFYILFMVSSDLAAHLKKIPPHNSASRHIG